MATFIPSFIDPALSMSPTPGSVTGTENVGSGALWD